MANNKNFKIKNGLSATRYLNSTSNVTSATVIDGYNVDEVGGITYDNVFFQVSSNESDARKMFWSADGTKLFHIGNSSSKLWEYTCSTAYDISTAGSGTSSTSLTSNKSNVRGGFFKPDGTYFYTSHLTDDYIIQWELSTPWSVSTLAAPSGASFGDHSISLSSDVTTLDDVEFSSDGTKMIVVDISGYPNNIKSFDLSTAWDVTTATYDTNTNAFGTVSLGNPSGIRFSPDGLEMFITKSSAGSRIYKGTLTSAWDISTLSVSSNYFDTSSQLSDNVGVEFNDDGTKMYVLNRISNARVYQYTSGTSTNTKTLDLSAGNTFSFTPSSAVTMIFTNPPPSGKAIGFTLEVVNTGGYALTWPSSVKWHLGAAPTATATKELYTFITTDGGTTYYGKLAGSDIA
jgi:hypothetical protein